MREGYTYIVDRDYGFAPNPYYMICTLATCKPIVRKHIEVGGYVFGISPVRQGSRLIYAMRVTEKMSFNNYWGDQRYQLKKPRMNGSKKTAYGDNIYKKENGRWLQSDSHHSYAGGIINEKNLNTDTGTTDQVLLSDEFFYFGAKMIEVPDKFKGTIALSKNGHHLPQGQKPLTKDECKPFWDWLCNNYDYGRHGDPVKFSSDFERFKGNP